MNSIPNFSSDSTSDSSPDTPALVAVKQRDAVFRIEKTSPLESVGDLDSMMSTLAVSPATSIERAHGVLAILRRLVHAESASFNLGGGLGRFLEWLWSGPIIEGLVRGVHSRAVALAQGRVGEGLDESRLLSDLRTIVEWYSMRRASIGACQREGFSDGDTEALFNLHIAHDIQRWGVAGMSISCGLRFIARAHETVWLKVFARCHGEAIETREGWSSWCDETGSIGGGEGATPRRFAAISPVQPSGQRVYIDRVEQFVPYGALALPAGRHEVELDVGVYNERGELLISAGLVETIQIPRGDEGESVVPSPQALGLWSVDPVRGDAITIVGSHLRLDGDPGWEEQICEVAVDLTLVGMAGERATLELILRCDDGVIVEPREDDSPARPLASIDVLPQQTVAHFSGLRVGGALRDLDLIPGQHRLLVEVTVRSADRKIRCGAYEPILIEVRGLSAPPARRMVDRPIICDGEVNVADVHIAPLDFNGQLSLGVTTTVGMADWEIGHHQMVVSLECRDGTPILNGGAADRPVVRSFWFGGERGVAPGELRPLRAVFDAREFARFLKTRSSGEREIVAQIKVISDRGRILFETNRVVAGDFVSEVKVALPPRQSANPVEIVAVEIVESGVNPLAAALHVTLNVDRCVLPRGRVTLYHEWLDAQGITLAVANSSEELGGGVVAVDLPFRINCPVGRWYQTHVVVPEVMFPNGGTSPGAIGLSSYGPRGEYWETVQSALPLQRAKARQRRSSGSSGGGVPREGGAFSEERSIESSRGSLLLSKLRSAFIG